MARLFDDSQMQYLQVESAVVGAYPIGIACRFRTNDDAANQTLIWVGDKDVSNHFCALDIDSTFVRARQKEYDEPTSEASAVTSSGVTEGTWHHAAGLWLNTTERHAYIDGGSKGSNTSELGAPHDHDRTAIGACRDSTVERFMSGDIAEAAIWDLTDWGENDAEREAAFEAILSNLAAGVRPSVYPTGLLGYWPLVSDDLDDADDFDLTPYNDPSWSTHPPVLCLLTESANAASAQDCLLIKASEITESASATDEQAASKVHASEITETAASSDTQDSTWAYSAEITEIASASDEEDAIRVYIEIPPFMQKDLIDPYSGGAWLWLVKIAVPGYDAVRIARNTEDVCYGENDFDKFNLQIGEQLFSGDGSIPRVTLQVFQDMNRRVEDIVNATEGALGAQMKLIRVNEKWLDTPVSALEADYDNLASQSDSEWVTFTLGIPNPLTQRFPLRDYSSSMCPWAPPAFFKGPRCQYTGEDTSCTGTYEDCYAKGNAEHWGGELGLDPNVVKI